MAVSCDQTVRINKRAKRGLDQPRAAMERRKRLRGERQNCSRPGGEPVRHTLLRSCRWDTKSRISPLGNRSPPHTQREDPGVKIRDRDSYLLKIPPWDS